MKYQIYSDSGNGPELDGCWGSENASFDDMTKAIEASAHLAELYPDCDWVVMDGQIEVNRIPATEQEETE